MRAVYHHDAISPRPGSAVARKDGLFDFAGDDGFIAEAVESSPSPQHERVCLLPDVRAEGTSVVRSSLEAITDRMSKADILKAISEALST